jgi:hypothetical protein
MSLLRIIAALAGVGLSGGPASAADLAFDGSLRAGVYAGADRATGFVAADLRLVLPRLAGPLGFEAGAFGLGIAADTPHETYASVIADFGAFRLGAGVPRPGFDSFAISPLERLVPVRGLAGDRIAATRSRVTWGAMYGGDLPVGALISGQAGSVGWALSAHRVKQRDLTVASLGLGWEAKDWRLGAGVEWGSDGEIGGKAQVERDFAAVTLGVSAYAARPGNGHLSEGFLAWRATDRMTVSALVQVQSGAGDALAVVAAHYGFERGGTASLAVTAEGGQAAASIGFDMRF